MVGGRPTDAFSGEMEIELRYDNDGDHLGFRDGVDNRMRNRGDGSLRILMGYVMVVPCG